MRLRSGRRLISPPAPRSGGGADRISALADNLLLLVLARLGCVRTAARAGVLSRRWRGLWTRLPALVFRDVAFRALEPALAHVASSASAHAVSLVDMRLRKREWSLRASAPSVSVTSLLRAAARLSPEHLVLALPWGAATMFEDVELPSFQRATSISLTSWSPINLRAPSGGELLPALTTLVLLGCTADGLAAQVARCPCLRTLRLSRPGSSCVARIPLDITVHSSSLRELVVEETQAYVDRIDVATPMLEQLTVSALGASRLSVSVLAPMAGNVSWRCRYYKDIWLLDAVDRRLAYWTVETVSLLSAPTTAADRPRPPVLRIDALKNKYGALENSWTQAKARQIEQHLQMEVAADLSVLDLELNLTTLGHVYGAAVFFFLNMHPIRTAIHRLKLRVGLPDPDRAPTDEEECGEHCKCAPTNWTSQVISLTELAEVEINGFQGDHHEFDVLERLFRCAPKLRKMILKQSDKVAPSDTKVHDFFEAYPSVEWY